VIRRGASLDELEALYRSRFDVFLRVAASVTGDGEGLRMLCRRRSRPPCASAARFAARARWNAAIGEALGIAEGTVAATLNAAHAALRTRLHGVNSKIAFMHNTRKNCCPHELWIMNAEGSKPVRVARDASWGVAWSPDERQIAYFKGGSWRGGI
jgi:hypothetical protein